MPWNSIILKAWEVQSERVCTGSDIHEGKIKCNLSLWMFVVYICKEANWDLNLKEKAQIEEGWRTSSSPFVPSPWAEPAVPQRLLPTVTITLSVCTIPRCGRFLLPHMFFTSYLQDHQTIALCGTITLHRSTWSQNHIFVA